MIRHVLGNLYVGDDSEITVGKAIENGFAVVHACKDGSYSHRAMLGYTSMAAPKGDNYYFVEKGKQLGLNIVDTDDPAWIPKQVIDAAMTFIQKRSEAGDKVLVHCNAGHSRSPSIGLMYLRTIGEMPHSFVQSEKVYRTLYSEYNPSAGIRQYARSHWAELENKVYGQA